MACSGNARYLQHCIHLYKHTSSVDSTNAGAATYYRDSWFFLTNVLCRHCLCDFLQQPLSMAREFDLVKSWNNYITNSNVLRVSSVPLIDHQQPGCTHESFKGLKRLPHVWFNMAVVLHLEHFVGTAGNALCNSWTELWGCQHTGFA